MSVEEGKPPERVKMPRRTTDTQERERTAYNYRRVGWEWHSIARMLWGTDRESTARAAARRYALREGLPVFGDARQIRTTAGLSAAAQRWSQFTQEARHRLAAAGQPVPTSPIGLRTFGVEIEFVQGHRLSVAAALDEVLGYHVHATTYHGNRCVRCGQAVTGYTQWKVETDSTVTVGEYGGEVVSPVLHGEEGLDQIAAVMEAIKQTGGKVDQRCGLHVHLGVDDLTGQQRATVVEKWYEAHDHIDRLVNPRRVGHTYCLKETRLMMEKQVEQLRRTGTTNLTSKMRTLNLAPLSRIGTMEVRYHEGCLRPREMRAWVTFLTGFFELARRGVEIPTDTLDNLLQKMVDENLMPEVRKNHLLNTHDRRVGQLAA